MNDADRSPARGPARPDAALVDRAEMVRHLGHLLDGDGVAAVPSPADLGPDRVNDLHRIYSGAVTAHLSDSTLERQDKDTAHRAGLRAISEELAASASGLRDADTLAEALYAVGLMPCIEPLPGDTWAHLPETAHGKHYARRLLVKAAAVASAGPGLAGVVGVYLAALTALRDRHQRPSSDTDLEADLIAKEVALRAALAGGAGGGWRPPFRFQRFVDGCEKAQDVVVERAKSLAEAVSIAARICPRRPGTVLVFDGTWVAPPRAGQNGGGDAER